MSDDTGALRKIISDEWGSHLCYYDDTGYPRNCDPPTRCRCNDIAKAILNTYAVRRRRGSSEVQGADAMSDDSKDIKIGGISPSEYVRGIKNGNIDPTYDNAVKALLWAADEIERLREENRKLREAARPKQFLFCGDNVYVI